jgi:hypothetical protein
MPTLAVGKGDFELPAILEGISLGGHDQRALHCPSAPCQNVRHAFSCGEVGAAHDRDLVADEHRFFLLSQSCGRVRLREKITVAGRTGPTASLRRATAARTTIPNARKQLAITPPPSEIPARDATWNGPQKPRIVVVTTTRSVPQEEERRIYWRMADTGLRDDAQILDCEINPPSINSKHR